MKDGVTRIDRYGAHRYACGIHGVSGLLGITTYMRTEAAEGLEYWKRDQLLRLMLDRRARLDQMVEDDGYEDTLKHFHGLGRGAGKEARDIGSDVHKWIEKHVKGKQPPIPEHIGRHVESFLQWFEDKRPEVRHSEYFVVSEAHGYGGTGDLTFVMDGEFWGVDVKTGKLLAETGMQLAALRWADHAGRPGDPTSYPVPQTTAHGVLLVHEDETTLEPFHITRDREFARFLHNVALYELKKRQDEVFEASVA